MEVTLSEHKVGPFRVVVARFNKGDTMALHRHTGRGHLSIVPYGKLISHVTDHGDVALDAEAIVYWPLGTEHSWEALENSMLINVFVL